MARKMPEYDNLNDVVLSNKDYDRPSFLNNYIKSEDEMITKPKPKQEVELLRNDILPEYLNWATSAGGITSTR